MSLSLRLLGVLILIWGGAGLTYSCFCLGGLLGADFLGTAVAAGGTWYALFLLSVSVLDLFAYGGLVAVGLGLLGARSWARSAGFWIGCYLAPTLGLRSLLHYLYVIQPAHRMLVERGGPSPLGPTAPSLAAITLLWLAGTALLVGFSVRLILLGRHSRPVAPPRPARKAARPESRPGAALAWRASLALALMAGFYGLAVLTMIVLLWIPYAEFRYAERLHLQVAAFCIGGAFVIAKSILPRRDRFEPPGPELRPGDQPRIFAELRAVARATQQQMPVTVYLVPDVNAWVTQRGGFMGFGGRRVMGVGLPLLQVLDVAELRAVISHEFGHYHGGDVKLGPWIYKTRAALGRTLLGLARHSELLMKPFEVYGALFLRVTQAISRHQELQADALAARVAGGDSLASALRTVHGASLAFAAYWENEVAPVLSAGYLPPLADGFARFVREPAVAEVVRKAIEAEAREGRRDPYDTHPALRDRLAALPSSVPAASAAPHAPAISLLGATAGLEKELVERGTGLEGVSRLRAVRWEEVGALVYGPRWRKFLLQHGSALAGVSPGSLPALDWDSVGAKLARALQREPSERGPLAEFAVGAALATALNERGFLLEASPGGAVTLRRAEQHLEPFTVRTRLAAGGEAAELWRAFCADTQIGELDLGTVARR